MTAQPDANVLQAVREFMIFAFAVIFATTRLIQAFLWKNHKSGRRLYAYPRRRRGHR